MHPHQNPKLIKPPHIGSNTIHIHTKPPKSIQPPLCIGSNTIFCRFYATDADWAADTPYFMEFYDLHADPDQMHNTVDTLGLTQSTHPTLIMPGSVPLFMTYSKRH